MKKLLLFFTAVVAVVMGSVFADEPSGFAKKVELTLSDTAKEALGEGAFDNVPILVKLSTAIQDFSYADFQGVRGADMVFSDGNGNVIPHEVDTWDPSGTSLVWIKPGSLSASIGKVVMYFGNAEIPASSATGVWGDYIGVWHMGDFSTENVYPNAANGGTSFNGELSATYSTANEEGAVGKCFRVNNAAGQTGNFNYGGVFVRDPDATLLPDDSFTISGWFKHNGATYYWDHYFYKKSALSAGEPGFAIENRNAGTKRIIGPCGCGNQGQNANIEVPDSNGTWTYLTFVYNGAKCTVYGNGAKIKDTTIVSVTGSGTLPLGIGNSPAGIDNAKGDAAWGGWIDEVRLRDDVPTDEWLAVEYKAMTTDFFDFGTVEVCDATAPRFGVPAVCYDSANGGFVFSVEMTAGSGDLYAVVTDMATGVVTTNLLENGQGASVPGTYSKVLSGLAFEHTFTAAAYARSTGGSDINRGGATFYTGALAFEGVQDADEGTLGEGVLTVSRSALPAAISGDLVVTYAVAGTAVSGTDYEPLSGTVTIPSGSASAEIRVKPIFNSDKDESVTVTLTPAATSNFATDGTESATIQIINHVADNTVRYVSTSGSDDNDGLSLVMAKATIADAVASLADVEGACKVYVAPGTYTETAAATPCVDLSRSIEVIGTTGDPKDVIVKAKVDKVGIFKLSHEGAAIRNLTASGGKGGNGGNANMTAGLIENCILENGYASAWNGGGGNVYMTGGRVSRCVVRGGYTSPTSTDAGRQVGGGVRASGGIVENSLIAGNYNSYAPAARLNGTAKLVNCTITGNYNEKTSEGECGGTVRVESKNAFVVNCVIYGNTCVNDVTGHDAIYTVSDDSFTENFINCAAEQQINVTCKAIDETVFADYAKGGYTPIEGCSLVDAGTDYAAAGGMSDKDVAGAVRESGRGVDIGAYEFQYSESFMSFGGAPTFVFDAANDRVEFSVVLATGRGSVWAIFTDMGTQESVTNLVSATATGGNAYFCYPTLASDVVYSCAALAVGLDGYDAFAEGTNTIYTGEIAIEKVADAYEENCVAGAFRISRGSGISATAGDLSVAYDVAGTVVPDSVYKQLSGTAVIPAGASSVLVEIAPMICPSVTVDTSVELTLKLGNYKVGNPSSAALTVYNCADYDGGEGACRFVSTTGDDNANDGLTAANAFASVTKAVTDLGEDGGRVYIAAGTYTEPGASESALTITTPIELLGMTGNPKDVVITRVKDGVRILNLGNESAKIRMVTLSGGRITAHSKLGGTLLVSAGTVEDCIIADGYNGGNSGNDGGGNLAVTGGRVSRCVIKGGNLPNCNSFRANRQSGGAFVTTGGVIENSLIIGNKGGVATGVIYGGGEVVNCTITDNESQCGGIIMVVKNKNVGKVRNCVIVGNRSTRTNANPTDLCYVDSTTDWGIDTSGSAGFGGYVNEFENCLGDVKINESCVVGDASIFVDQTTGDYRLGIVNEARDAGVAYADTGATSTTDLAGKARVIGSCVDIGAYEFDPSVPFADIMFTQGSRITPVTLSATANFVGLSGTAVYYWDLDGDGIFERQSESSTVGWTIENGIGPGRIAMRVDVDGTVIGAVSRYFDYAPSDIYVKDDSANAVYPYCTEETAARTLQDALSVPGNGMTIHLAAGTYSSSATSAKFDVTNGVRIIGMTGNPDDVIIQNTATVAGNSSYKTITVNHSDAFVANVTISGARIRNVSGSAGLIMGSNGGTVSNCVIRGNNHSPAYYQASAGVSMSAGLVTHCVITNNLIDAKSTQENDTVAVAMSGGALENSFIGANRVTGNVVGKCYAVRATGGRIVNCDIIGNDLSSTNELAGALDVSGTAVVSNTVIFGNTKREIVDNGDETTSTNVVSALVTGAAVETALTACATDLTITAAAFTDYANGKFTPAYGGPLFNAGVTPAGWAGSGIKDLAGHKRVIGSRVDIGCYEYSVPVGIKIILR